MGGALSALEQSFPPKPTWGVDDISDLTGKVILVTGALSEKTNARTSVCSTWCSSVGGNAGVGKETVKVR